MKRALIDTSAVYAFVVARDSNHDAAIRFARAWQQDGGGFLLPDLVFFETVTLLKARFGSRVALAVGARLREDPAYSWHQHGEANELATWALFEQYHDKAWSYTDCAILALARRESIAQVFAFDHHFEQMPEVRRVPDLAAR